MAPRFPKPAVADQVLWEADSQIEIRVQGALLGHVLGITFCGRLKEAGVGRGS